MSPANTICVSQEGPANALAQNKDCTQVVIAGRNVFKVFGIGETEFTEVCNLRVGKNLNLNYSSIDVAWSTIEENTLATAATNGAVVVWNLGRSGRSKQEHVFSDHKRTVNKVSFHLTEPSLLISGSQDGTMKCFDLRMKEVARTFISNTESVRDVQFNRQSTHQFAAVSENGSVQVWDVRRGERPVQQFTAHSGPVFACDWHPDLPWLATASRDKTIKVWDMHAKPTLEHTIYTIASVGHVKWRPQRKHQVASCALVLDCAVHVWDVRRPHVPLATFGAHRDVTTALAWHGGPHAFLATSRDCGVYRHRWAGAAHPALRATPHAAALSARNCMVLAASLRDPPRVHGRKQWNAGALSSAEQTELERIFPLCARSAVWRWSLGGAVALYRTHGAPLHELAAHNAGVATRLGRPLTAHVWRVLAAVFPPERPAPRPPPRRPPPPDLPPPPMQSYCPPEDEPIEETEDWENNQFHNSGVLGLPTHSIYIPPASRAQNVDDNDESAGWISAASAHYVDEDAADWSLPEEAFPLRAVAVPGPTGPTAPTGPTGLTVPTGPPAPTASLDCEKEDGNVAPSASPGGTSTGSGSSRFRVPARNSSSEETEATLFVSSNGGGAEWRAGPLLATALIQHAALGDVVTPVSALLALPQHHRNEILPYIDESLQEQWLLAYIELLHRLKLFNVATEVIRNAWVGSVWALSQQSTAVATCCARCGRRGRPCDACGGRGVGLCAVCNQVVHGLYAWCQGCAHGGHLHHMQKWMQTHRLCPAGCGHHCRLP